MLPDGIYLHRDEEAIWPASANALLVRDPDGAVLVDVGCGKEEVYLRLKDFLASHGLEIGDVHTVVLTHAHPDHMGAMRYLLEETRPRVLLHPVEAPLAAEPSRLNHTFDMALPLRYGINPFNLEKPDILEYFSNLCPMASADATHIIEPDGELELGRFRFKVVVTPGHANGLVSLFEPESGMLFTADAVGDVVAWYSPSSGGLTGFLEGLDRLAGLPAAFLVPSHGEISGSPSREIARTRERLLRREKKILGELAAGPVSFQELASRVFRNPMIAFFPGPQILRCHLDKLEAEGRVRCRGEEEGWLVEALQGVV
ncbi:MAG: MBL fold metallo-hydrolase [Actinobacteria bacterium]|nr:MBL fold metallo-hydrolase [Actinomycetota bacterium]